MKFNKYLSTGLCLTAALALSSCFDNDYDLGDLDGSIRVAIKDLTVPLNVDPNGTVKLDKIMDIDSDSQIQKMRDPESDNEKDSIFAIIESGTFNSDNVEIDAFTAKSPNIDPISDDLELEKLNKELDQQVDNAINTFIENLMAPYADLQAVNPTLYNEKKAEATAEANTHRDEFKATAWNSVSATEKLARYPISNNKTKISTDTKDVDAYIHDIKNVDINTEFKVDITLNNLTQVIKNVNIEGFKIQLPKGLTLDKYSSEYNSETGILDLTGTNPKIVDGKYSLSIKITNVSLYLKDGKKNPDIYFTKGKNKDEEGEFKIDGNSCQVHVMEGCYVNVTKNDFQPGKTFFDLPDEASYVCTPTMSDIKVTSFTGDIEYKVENTSVNPITFDNIPDVLSDDETNIFLNNPQLYLSINNPISNYGLTAKAGLSFENEKGDKYTMDNDLVITDEDYAFCISPEKPKYYEPGFAAENEKIKDQKFTDLDKILSGNGVPSKLNVDIINPRMDLQSVTEFPLGKNFGSVEGKYTFFAPLDLSNVDPAKQSIIMYKDTLDGWSDETLEKITIDKTGKIWVSARITTDLPLGAKLHIQFIDKEGNKIEGIEFNECEIPANANARYIEFENIVSNKSKDIKGAEIDGVIFSATLIVDKGALKPEQGISLRNVKLRIQKGYYDEPDTK